MAPQTWQPVSTEAWNDMVAHRRRLLPPVHPIDEAEAIHSKLNDPVFTYFEVGFVRIPKADGTLVETPVFVGIEWFTKNLKFCIKDPSDEKKAISVEPERVYLFEEIDRIREHFKSIEIRIEGIKVLLYTKVIDHSAYQLVLSDLSTFRELLTATETFGTTPGVQYRYDVVLRAERDLEDARTRMKPKIEEFRAAAALDVRLTVDAVARAAKLLLTAQQEQKPGANKITNDNVSRVIFEHCIQFSALTPLDPYPQLLSWSEDTYLWVQNWVQGQEIWGGPFMDEGGRRPFNLLDLIDLAASSPLAAINLKGKPKTAAEAFAEGDFVLTEGLNISKTTPGMCYTGASRLPWV